MWRDVRNTSNGFWVWHVWITGRPAETTESPILAGWTSLYFYVFKVPAYFTSIICVKFAWSTCTVVLYSFCSSSACVVFSVTATQFHSWSVHWRRCVILSKAARKAGRGRWQLAARQPEIMAAPSPSSAAHFSLLPLKHFTRGGDAMPFSGVVTGGEESGIIIISHLSLTFHSPSRSKSSQPSVSQSVSPSERQSAFLPPEEERWQEQDESITVPETRGWDFALKAFCCIKPKTKQLLSNYKLHFSVFDLWVSLLPFKKQCFKTLSSGVF